MRGRLSRERGRTRPPRLQPSVKTSTLTADTAKTRSGVFVVPDYNNNNNRERILRALYSSPDPKDSIRFQHSSTAHTVNTALQYVVSGWLLLLQPIRNAFLARFSVDLRQQYGISQALLK